DVRVVAWSIDAFGLPKSLKLSIHTGSDKFSIYKGIGEIIRKEGVGLHLKTAGTTWLEEIVGLADAGGDGLAMAKEIYRAAYSRFDEEKIVNQFERENFDILILGIGERTEWVLPPKIINWIHDNCRPVNEYEYIEVYQRNIFPSLR
ncbi:MAG TPA: tagaturonate epimerase family protein, partial [Smithella sp.]|nr:tagaturonate epimerase family protein [Smithella sp.]